MLSLLKTAFLDINLYKTNFIVLIAIGRDGRVTVGGRRRMGILRCKDRKNHCSISKNTNMIYD
jgi:hypothetical protein